MSERERTCIVTGSNTGIGKASAQLLADAGFSVVMACRDVGKAQAAKDDLVARGVPAARLTVMQLDLGSLASIRAFAKRCESELPRIDVLLNNAGAWMHERFATADGFEGTYGINHLGPFLLTQLLLPMLERSERPRVVNVASEVHRQGSLDRLLDDPMAERGPFKGLARYSDSKLANVMVTRELARRLSSKGSNVSVNALHPGVVASDFMRDLPAIARGFVKLFFKSPERGAATSVYLASAPDVADVSGGYFVDCKQKHPSRKAQQDDANARLWAMSERQTGLA